ncbi:hypothetical protein GGS24DRAFT_507719 [Hypoxylon argillaceum]|nr:hypothetical protein GGS24DRAFT_507719 [Hypoxylon argillaceum]
MPEPSELPGLFFNDVKGMELLERVARTCHYGILRLISPAGSRVRLEIIHKAISNYHLSLMKVIMKIDKFEESAYEVLLDVTKEGNRKAVELLVAAGSGSNIVRANKARRNALYLAAKAGHFQIVNILLKLATDEDNASLWIAYHQLTINPDWPPARVLYKAASKIPKLSLPQEGFLDADNFEMRNEVPSKKDTNVLPP